MGWMDMLLGVGGMGMNIWGGLLQDQMAREDRAYWQGQTKDAQNRLQEFGDRAMPQVQGMSDDLSSRYSALAGDWSRGSREHADSAYGDWKSFYDTLTGGYETGSTGVKGMSSNRIGELGTSISNLKSGMDSAYGNRLSTGMSMLKDYGNQSRKDIQKSFADQTQSELARLGSVGLGNTSAGSVMRRGMAEQETDALGRLNESLTKIGLDTYSGLSGDQLASRSGLGQFGIGMMDSARGQDIGLSERLLNTGTDLAGMYGEKRINAGTELGEFALMNDIAARQALLGEQERFAMTPINYERGLISEKNATALDWGLPPEVIPWQLGAGQNMTNMWNVRQTRKGQEAASNQNGGSISLLGSGFSW